MAYKCHVPYVLQLVEGIHPAEPHMTPNTLHRFWTLMKFSVDRHFIYITMCVDGHKQQIQSYYKLMEDDLEEITKEWSTDLLVPGNPAEMSDVDSPKTAPDTPGPSKTKNTKKP